VLRCAVPTVFESLQYHICFQTTAQEDSDE